MQNPILSKIRIYPIKSLSHVELTESEVGTHSLLYDRQYAMIDETGRVMNGKRNPRVNLLQANYNLKDRKVSFINKETKHEESFDLDKGNKELDEFISDFFDTPLRLVENNLGQFMDIPKESSVTIVSTESLRFLEKRMDGYSIESLRLRFRPTIEISGVPPFWEETLYEDIGIGIKFKIGDVTMVGVSPRARCNVPPQNPETGELERSFVADMLKARNELLTEHSYLLELGRTTYFLTMNTFVPKSELGKRISIGDKLIVGTKEELPFRSIYG